MRRAAVLWMLTTACGASETRDPTSAPTVEIDPTPATGIEPQPLEDVDEPIVGEAPIDAATGDGDPCSATDSNRLYAAVSALAAKEIGSGMKEGAFGCRNLGEGQQLGVPVMLEAGKCFAFVAHGDPAEVDLALRPNMEGMNLPLLPADLTIAMDDSTGGDAIIGRGGNCYANAIPIPMPAMIYARATQGGGSVAVATFSK